MKAKKNLLSLFLFLFMFCSISCVVSAQWKTEGGDRFYYANGQKVTGGPRTIDGKKYFFTSEGKLITGKVTIKNGKICVSKSDGSLLTGWGSFGGKNYYGKSDGYCKTGLQKYKDNYYYFSPSTGAMVKKKLVTVGGNTYYFDSAGKAVKSRWITYSKGRYYFGKDRKALHGPQKIGKYYYVFKKSTGKMESGSVKYGSYYYYLDTKTGRALTNAWKTLNGKKYYYDSRGRRKTGWLTIGTKRYYLDPAKKGAMTTGTKVISGKTYKFGSKGYVSKSTGKIVVKVNTKKCVVTVYDGDEPIKAMTCSPGRAGCETPNGVFTIRDHLSWWVLNGPTYGQYCSHFLSAYLFHSVPMHTTRRDPYKVSSYDFNNLGKPASAGCIRLSVADAKWIYYNVPIGSTVVISTTEATPLGKPKTRKMANNTVGADPTDDFKNPGGYDVSIRKK